jgi:hypothetical protein
MRRGLVGWQQDRQEERHSEPESPLVSHLQNNSSISPSLSSLSCSPVTYLYATVPLLHYPSNGSGSVRESRFLIYNPLASESCAFHVAASEEAAPVRKKRQRKSFLVASYPHRVGLYAVVLQLAQTDRPAARGGVRQVA